MLADSLLPSTQARRLCIKRRSSIFTGEDTANTVVMRSTHISAGAVTNDGQSVYSEYSIKKQKWILITDIITEQKGKEEDK